MIPSWPRTAVRLTLDRLAQIRTRRWRFPAPFRVVLSALVLLIAPTHTEAQGLLPSLAGGAGGLVSGGLVSVGIVAFRARSGDYFHSVTGALGWAAAPILVGTVGGAVLGSRDHEHLGRAARGALIGGGLGAGIGVVLARRAWPELEGRWAGGVIGGAAGLVLGTALGVVWPKEDQDHRQPPRGPILPLALTIRF